MPNTKNSEHKQTKHDEIELEEKVQKKHIRKHKRRSAKSHIQNQTETLHAHILDSANLIAKLDKHRIDFTKDEVKKELDELGLLKSSKENWIIAVVCASALLIITGVVMGMMIGSVSLSNKSRVITQEENRFVPPVSQADFRTPGLAQKDGDKLEMAPNSDKKNANTKANNKTTDTTILTLKVAPLVQEVDHQKGDSGN